MEKKRLKIAICCDCFYPMIDGVVTAVDNYAKILSKDHDVTVFVPESTEKDYVDNFDYKVIRCKNFPISFGDYITPAPGLDKHFRQELRKGFDIIHMHSPFTIAKAAVKVAKKQNIPTVITMHCMYKDDFMEKTKSRLLTKIMMKYIGSTFSSCDELWTMNKRLEEVARNYHYARKDQTVWILPNGCNVETDIDESEAKKLRQQYAKDDEKVLLFVGRIHILKRIDFILETCNFLKDKNFPFKMLFVGIGQDFDKFNKMTQELGLSDHVKFLGKITDRTKLSMVYKISDLFVFPSIYDCDALVKKEAAAFETPTIFVNGTICSSEITDGENGYLTDDTPQAFADKILKIFADEKTYKKVCKNAKESLYKTWDETVKKVVDRYYKVIEEHKGRKNEKRKNRV